MKENKMTPLPVKKYPIDYKCTHIYDISNTLEKHGLDITNLQPNVPTKNSYHDFNFHDFISKKLQKENTIYPKVRLIDISTSDDPRMDDFTDRGSVVMIPKHYDSSNDDATHKIKTESGRNRLIDLFRQAYKGKKLEKAISDMDEHVDFGRGNFEWSNIALDVIYEEYKQYFNNGYLRVWMPLDWDSGNEFYSGGDNTSNGYPMEKMLHLSDIEAYLDSNYNLKDELFFQYIVHNNYIEARDWERPLGLYVDINGKFVRKGGKYGMDATETIDKMLSILEMEYKDLIKELDDEYFPIYIDYYKKVKNKY